MNPFRRHDMVTCGFLASGIGVTAGMYGLVDIGNSPVQVLYMRALSGVKVLMAGYCNPADGVKTTDDTMSIVTTTIGMAAGMMTGMTIARANGMTMEDTKIVES
jgi:hypothetical protein